MNQYKRKLRSGEKVIWFSPNSQGPKIRYFFDYTEDFPNRKTGQAVFVLSKESKACRKIRGISHLRKHKDRTYTSPNSNALYIFLEENYDFYRRFELQYVHRYSEQLEHKFTKDVKWFNDRNLRDWYRKNWVDQTKASFDSTWIYKQIFLNIPAFWLRYFLYYTVSILHRFSNILARNTLLFIDNFKIANEHRSVYLESKNQYLGMVNSSRIGTYGITSTKKEIQKAKDDYDAHKKTYADLLRNSTTITISSLALLVTLGFGVWNILYVQKKIDDLRADLNSVSARTELLSNVVSGLSKDSQSAFWRLGKLESEQNLLSDVSTSIREIGTAIRSVERK